MKRPDAHSRKRLNPSQRYQIQTYLVQHAAAVSVMPLAQLNAALRAHFPPDWWGAAPEPTRGVMRDLFEACGLVYTPPASNSPPVAVAHKRINELEERVARLERALRLRETAS
jgi:hypothetical protein